MNIFKGRPYLTDIYIPISDKALDEETYPEASRLHGRMVIVATKHEDSIVWYYARCFDGRLKGDKKVSSGYIPFKANIPTVKDIVLDCIRRNDYYVDYSYAVKLFGVGRHVVNAAFMFPLGPLGVVNYSDIEEVSAYNVYREYVSNSTIVGERMLNTLENAYWIFDSQKTPPLTIVEYDRLKDKEPHTKVRNIITTIRTHLSKLKKEKDMFVPKDATQQKLI